MKAKQILTVPILLLGVVFQLRAQQQEPYDRNIIKLNLTSLILKNYSVQYERILKKSISAALGVRVMPATGIPFKSLVLDATGDEDPEIRKAIEALTVSNFAITPEVRFYPGRKGYGRGFYIGVFYRFARYNADGFAVEYDNFLNGKSSVVLSGDMTTHTGGIMIGAQWFLGKRISLDWWILGAHVGAGNGTLSGASSYPPFPGRTGRSAG